MKKQLLSIISLGLAAASSAQVYITEQMSMPNVMSVTNEGMAVGYCKKNEPFYIWNPIEDTYKEIGGISPGDGVGGAARFSTSGLKISAPMYSEDIPMNTEWVHSTIKEMEGLEFSQIVCVSGDMLYAVASAPDGKSGAVIRSASSGTSWKRYDYIQRANAEGQQEIVRPDFGITCFAAINHRYLLIGTTTGQIMTDGGSGTWKETSLKGIEPEKAVKTVIAMDFTYELVNEYGAERAVTGCIAAELEDGTGAVWYTDDKATSFKLSEGGFDGIPVSIGNNGSDFFMSTTAGKLYISADRGKSWTENMALPQDIIVARTVFADSETGVALANKSIYITRDGGKTWTAKTIQGAENVDWKNAAWNENQLLITGTDGTCYMSNGFGDTFRKQTGFEGTLGAANYKVSAEVFNVIGNGGEAYRMTAIDKFSGYTAGIYDVESGSWTTLPGAGYSDGMLVSSPWNISGNGQYVVGTIRDLDKTASVVSTYAGIWDGPDNLTILPNRFSADGKSCRANAVNHDGSIVAGWQDKFGPWFACLWIKGEDGNYTQKFLSIKKDFDPDTFDFNDKVACMETFPGYCQVISPDGKWVGGQGDLSTAIHGAWIWSEETGFKTISDEGATNGCVTGITNDGSMAVGWENTNENPWIWTEENVKVHLQGYVSEKLGIDLGNFILCAPYSMSPNGRYICGYGKLNNRILGYVIDLDSKSGIENKTTDQVKAAVYPNPVADELHVDLPFDSAEVKTTITLVDMTGLVVSRIDNPAQSNVMDVRGLSKGMYILDVRSAGSNKSFKVIVK